jgi:putative Ca2+/H+ antiporter (TMEM165/GDT1 family)
MEAIWISAGVVALAEIGDKTQLLAIILAAKFRKPVPIILGILVATVLNHTAAAAIGYFVSKWLSGLWFQAGVGIAFLAMAAWSLVPDKADDGAATMGHAGVFLTTLFSFFIVEIGDKTQIATTLLAARYHEIALVTMGTTLGMMIANIPAVLLGEAATRVLPLKYVRMIAAAIFAAIGIWVLVAAFE